MRNFVVRLVALTLISLFLSAPIILAYADLDPSSLTLDELLELRKSIDEEIYSLGGKVVIPTSGEYVAGKDIAVGSYTITTYGDQYDSLVMKVTVYKSREAKNDYEKAISDYNEAYSAYRSSENKDNLVKPDPVNDSNYIAFSEALKIGQSCTFSIEDGQYLYIYSTRVSEYKDLTIEPAKGLFMN